MSPPLKKFAAALAILLLCATVVSTSKPSVARADPITIIITVVIAVTATAVYDYVSCDIHIIWGCDDGGGNPNGFGDTGIGGSKSGQNNPPVTPPLNIPGEPNMNGSASQGCTSTPNSCGMTASGFINAQGQCAATPPPISSCPSPVLGEFYADPDRVRSGNATALHWDATNATACSITGGGLSLQGLALSGDVPTNIITQRTEFSLTCENGVGGPTLSKTAIVNLIPSYEEI